MHPNIVQVHTRIHSDRRSIWNAAPQGAVQNLGKDPVKQQAGKKRPTGAIVPFSAANMKETLATLAIGIDAGKVDG
jgi:hypothetical protein